MRCGASTRYRMAYSRPQAYASLTGMLVTEMAHSRKEIKSISKLLSRLAIIATALTVKYTPSWVWVFFGFLFDILFFYFRRSIELLRARNPIRKYKKKLESCRTYEDWEILAAKIDSTSGNDMWRHNFVSEKYDYRLINDRLEDLRSAREHGDVLKMISLFRAGLIRNFGGISNKELYTVSYCGTKLLIEEYIDEVLLCLEAIHECSLDDDSISYNDFHQFKMDFFHDTKQTFGSTALILQGGSLFGLCHIGVVKALYEKSLLPKIISGNAVGSVVAALVCTLDDSSLVENLNALVSLIKSSRNKYPEEIIFEANSDSVYENVLQRGYSQDMIVFLEYVKHLLGNITFEEAYLKSGRILNILVHPSDSSVPSLLNYITAPNVLIVTAITCSIGKAFHDDAQLYIKNQNGEIIPFIQDPSRKVIFLSPHQVKSGVQSFGQMSPYTRLTELFNVNNFVISLARPYLAPLIGTGIKHSSDWYIKSLVKKLINMELRHRVYILEQFGIPLTWIKWLAVDERTPRSDSSEITVVPELRALFKDFSRVFDSERYEKNIPYWTSVGERSIWPLLPIHWTRTAIEFTLDDYYTLYKNGTGSTLKMGIE